MCYPTTILDHIQNSVHGSRRHQLNGVNIRKCGVKHLVQPVYLGQVNEQQTWHVHSNLSPQFGALRAAILEEKADIQVDDNTDVISVRWKAGVV